MPSKRRRPVPAMLVVAALGLAVAACKSSPTEPSVELTLDHRVLCSPTGHAFTIAVVDGFFPLVVGRQWVLEGIEDDEGEEILLRVVITVLDETEVVAGVTTRVVEERETEDGELIEVSRNYFARTDEGTLCYFGEAVDDYEDGEIVSHDGAWRADEGSNAPGIFLPANPQPEMIFQQEDAPGAQDLAGILELGATVMVPFATYGGALLAQDCNPVEDPGCNPLEDGDLKAYVEGVGLVADGPVELIEFDAGG